jgi:hypothetical protein
MKSAAKVLGLCVVLWIAFFASVAFVGGGGLLGPALAQGVRTMGPTFALDPGQTFTLDDGRKITIVAGTYTGPPAGFVFDWVRGGTLPYSKPEGNYWNCATKNLTANRSCADGVILHYWNPSTGEKQDVLLKHGEALMLPTPQPKKETP